LAASVCGISVDTPKQNRYSLENSLEREEKIMSIIRPIAKRKKRVMITVDADQWDKLQKDLQSCGYPWGSMSYYLAGCLNSLDNHLNGADPDEIQMPLFDLDELRELRHP